jgi:hypothetical protein
LAAAIPAASMPDSASSMTKHPSTAPPKKALTLDLDGFKRSSLTSAHLRNHSVCRTIIALAQQPFPLLVSRP